MSKAAAIGLGAGLALVFAAGFAALGGLPGFTASHPNVALVLAGGGVISPSTRALVRQTGPDGATIEITLTPAPLADGRLALTLPQSSESTLTDIVLIDGAHQLWRVGPQLLRLSPPENSADLLPLVAEPTALGPFLHGPFACAMALAGKNVALTRAPDQADITLSVNAQTYPLQQGKTGWTDAASGTTFAVHADDTATITLPDGSQAYCSPSLPAGLMPLDLAGEGWRLQVDSFAVALQRAGHAPIILPASGTLSQITGDRLNTVHFRADGLNAPTITATHATCTDNATGDQQFWRVAIGLPDGTELQACAGDPVRAEDGDWELVSLNAVYREFGGSLRLSARAFTADSFCHRHEGRVIRTGDSIVLVRERRSDLGECPARALPMANALDAALTSGLEIRPDKRGGIGLVGIGDDLKDGVYIRAKRSGGS